MAAFPERFRRCSPCRPAFPHSNVPAAFRHRRRERHEEDISKRDGWLACDGRAGGCRWTVSADPAQSSSGILQAQDHARSQLKTRTALEDENQCRKCWIGIRSSSTRSLRRIRRTPPVSGSGRSFTRRSSTPTTASNGATRHSSFTTGPPTARRAERRSSLRRTRRWSACSRPNKPALDASYAASLAALSDDCEHSGHRADDGARARRVSSAASPGEPRWRRPCSPGARPMGSA